MIQCGIVRYQDDTPFVASPILKDSPHAFSHFTVTNRGVLAISLFVLPFGDIVLSFTLGE
jgi:hypothetical protein